MINGSRVGIPRYFREKLGIEITTWSKIDRKERIIKDMDYLRSEFEKAYPKVKITSSLSSLVNYERMFEFWYESHQWNLANKVFEYYQRRNQLLRGKNSVY